MSRKIVSVEGGDAARRFARGTSSIRRRSMHVVERKEVRGSEEPGGAGRGAVDREGREAMVKKSKFKVAILGLIDIHQMTFPDCNRQVWKYTPKEFIHTIS